MVFGTWFRRMRRQSVRLHDEFNEVDLVCEFQIPRLSGDFWFEALKDIFDFVR